MMHDGIETLPSFRGQNYSQTIMFSSAYSPPVHLLNVRRYAKIQKGTDRMDEGEGMELGQSALSLPNPTEMKSHDTWYPLDNQ